MVTPTNRVRNEHGTHDKCHQYCQGEANREGRPVAVLLTGVKNEAIGRVGHHCSPYGRSDSRPRTKYQLPRSIRGLPMTEGAMSIALSGGPSVVKDGSREL